MNAETAADSRYGYRYVSPVEGTNFYQTDVGGSTRNKTSINVETKGLNPNTLKYLKGLNQ